jgi:hypothetical protein
VTEIDVVASHSSQKARRERVYHKGESSTNLQLRCADPTYKPSVGESKDAVNGGLEVEDGCMVASSSGKFKMRKVWDDGEDKELFEGYMDLKVRYSGLLARKGFGKVDSYNMTFWAVRKVE